MLPSSQPRTDGRQRLSRRSAEHFAEYVDQQDVRLGAGIHDSGRSQDVELLRRTGQGFVGAALCRPHDGQSVIRMADRRLLGGACGLVGNRQDRAGDWSGNGAPCRDSR